MTAVLTAKELAKQLRLSSSQVSRLAAMGRIPGARDLGTGTNHKWRFTEEIIDKWLMEERQSIRHEKPRRRMRMATPVQHHANSVSQATEIQKENGKAHGTEYPV